MRLVPAILSNLVLLAAALGYGSLLLPLMPRAFSQLDRLALTLLGGLGLLGTLLFCAGQVRFARKAILLILLLGVIIGLRLLVFVRPQVGPGASSTILPILPAAVVATVLVLTAVAGLAEPTGDIRMDAISYHFLGPRVWLHDGVIRPVPDECMTAFPAVVETQFAAVMALGGQRAPQFFSLVALSSLLLITASLAARMGLDLSGVWWAVALTATMPVLYRCTYGGFIDAVYVSLVLAAARIGFDAERPSHFLLFGAFCGFAMGTKYFGLIAWALLSSSIYLTATLQFGHSKMKILKFIGAASAVAFFVAAPWYLRNWLQLGSPIYPPSLTLSHFFHPRYLPPQAIQNFNEYFAKVREGMGSGPLSFFLLPFHLTFHPANFVNGAGGIGLAPLALAPFGILLSRRDPLTKGLGLFALLQTIAWFSIGQDPRYIAYVFVIAAIFAVHGWGYVVEVAPRFGAALSGLVIATSISYGLFMIALARAEDFHAAVSSSFEEVRRHNEIPYLESFEYLNKEPSVTKVLVLDSHVPTYYLDKSYLKLRGRFGEQPLAEAGAVPQLLRELPSLHISHVLDVRAEGAGFVLPAPPQNMSVAYQREDQRIYRVR